MFYCLRNNSYFFFILFFFQSQLEAYRCENERLRAGETAALSSMRQNAQVASKYLIKAAQDAETSIKCVEKPIYRNWHSSNSNNQLKWIEFHTLDMMDTIECVFSLFTGSCWQEERLCASYQSCWAQLTRSQRFQNNTFCTSLYCALTTSIIHLLFQITCFSHTVTFFFFLTALVIHVILTGCVAHVTRTHQPRQHSYQY